MNKFLVGFMLTFLISSCSTIYYVGETIEDVTLYSDANQAAGIKLIVPAKSRVLLKRKNKNYQYFIYQTSTGYAHRPRLSNYHKFNSASDGFIYGYSSSKKMVAPSYSPSQNTDSVVTTSPVRGRDSTISTQTSTGGTVNVKGYYRKDGTYVQPHTRSAPRKH